MIHGQPEAKRPPCGPDWRRSGLTASFGLAIILLLPQPRSSGMPDDGEIAEIRLERTPCEGTCPFDEVILRPDGTATYIGKRFVKREGRYTGTYNRTAFDRLEKLLESGGYFALEARYATRETCLSGVVTSVRRSGMTKRVVNYGDAGPLELWAIEKAIQGVVSEIEWEIQD